MVFPIAPLDTTYFRFSHYLKKSLLGYLIEARHVKGQIASVQIYLM